MEQIGSKEIITQQRIVRLFDKQLQYIYLGDWTERTNSNVEEGYLEKYLKATRTYSSGEVSSAINQLKRAVGNIAGGLYHVPKTTQLRNSICTDQSSNAGYGKDRYDKPR